MRELTPDAARRIALTAQGFNAPRPDTPAHAAAMRRAIERLCLLQIDSVNVLARAHYLPLYSRLGPYDRGQLDALIVKKPRHFFEYWAHEASILPVDYHPLLRWRMHDAARGVGVWRQLIPYAGERRAAADALLARINADGPLAASDVAAASRRKGMWEWSDAKHALEWLFWAGLVASTHRRGSFERVYDLPERVLPRAVIDASTPDADDAKRALILHAARALGIATAGDLRDYFRLSPRDAQPAIDRLVEDGAIEPVRVRGWAQQAYLHRDARAGRRRGGQALLSPFDPLIWHRPRAERLFGFTYQLEIYTPAAKRVHGYYVLPFLMDGAIVARVDLKADRQAGVLRVQRAHAEPAAPPETAARLMDELRVMAEWLGLSGIEITPADPFARRLRAMRP